MKTTISNIKRVHCLMTAAFVALLIALFTPVVYAQTVHKPSDFNHMKTGFPLTGVHVNVECETCHVGGIFRGTPTDCAGCHSAGRRVIATPKPANHIISNAPCETCHSNSVTFLGARFNHMGVQPKACMTCHNGAMGPGKPGGHVVTTLACDSCHRSSAWIPAGYDHTGVTPGSCTSCHGVTSTGKPSGHVLTASACDACHRTTGWIPAGYNHIGVVAGSCATCHNGSTAVGKTPGHIVTSAACDTCHFNFTTFVGAAYNHSGVVAGTCGTCHLGQSAGAKTKPAGHIPYTGNACDSCHSATAGYTSFVGPIMNHAVVAASSCVTCHSSSTNYLGGMTRMSVSHKNADVGVTGVDCSQSSCHKPAGSIGTSYINWTN